MADTDPAGIEEGEARGRSSIEFPYGDMEDAEAVALAVYNNAGTSCSIEQLAGFMGQALRGGGFRVKVNTAKAFGFIDNPRGQIVLTELGQKVCDPAQQATARVESFMRVPLYAALYNKFKGNVLPPRVAMTREIQNLGVIETQADRARQAFERSAERAGFFSVGRDRLVMPVVRAQEPPKDGAVEEKPKTPPPRGGHHEYDPLVQGLLNRLPSAGSDWRANDRATWLRALVMNFDVLYGGAGDQRIEIKVQGAAGGGEPGDKTS